MALWKIHNGAHGFKKGPTKDLGQLAKFQNFRPVAHKTAMI